MWVYVSRVLRIFILVRYQIGQGPPISHAYNAWRAQTLTPPQTLHTAVHTACALSYTDAVSEQLQYLHQTGLYAAFSKSSDFHGTSPISISVCFLNSGAAGFLVKTLLTMSFYFVTL